MESVASKVKPGMVDINSTLKYQDGAAAGTGMVLSSNGVVLTNNHVVEGSTHLTATTVVERQEVPGHGARGGSRRRRGADQAAGRVRAEDGAGG